MDEFPLLPPFTSKAALAKAMGITSRSVQNYCNIASIFVDDFLDQYPQLGNQRLTRHPLNNYQCWVIFCIYQFLKHIPNSELLKQSLEFDPKIQYQFSKKHFEATYPELSKNEDKTICGI